MGRGAGASAQTLVAQQLPHVEAAFGHRATAPVRSEVVPRARAEARVARLLDQQLPRDRAEAMEAAWHALGLLERSLELRESVQALYAGQAGGWYDPEADALFLLDEVPPMFQVAVIAHELAHALQDQVWDLERWLAGASSDEDRAAALQAVLEGHASDVMTRALLARSGLAPDGRLDLSGLDGLEGLEGLEALEGLEGLDAGDLTEGLGLRGMEGTLLGSMLPPSTPPALKVQLLFPYVAGARFVSGYRDAHPDDPAADALYRRPPATTAEVLRPALWESGTFSPDLRGPGTFLPDHAITYSSPLGRLLTHVLLTGQADALAGSSEGARWRPANHDTDVSISAGWRGDHVAVYQRQNATPGTNMPDSRVVVWRSEWIDERACGTAARHLAERLPAAQIQSTGHSLSLVVAEDPRVAAQAMEAIARWK